jgi:phosphatidylglycerophosphatase A
MLHKLIATYFFVGYLPKAPGTWGSFFALPLVWILYRLGLPYYVATLIFITLVGIWASYKTSIELNNTDPDEVVIDEVAGILVTFLFVKPTLLNLLLGFFLFRLIDITKPFPIKQFEKIPYGVGIMVDDLLAGVYAGLILLVLDKYFLPLLGK